MADPQNLSNLAPLQGSRRVFGTMVLSLAMFMNVLDLTIANVSINAIAGDLGASPAQATWVLTSYSICNAIAVLLTGWLALRFGQVRLMAASILLFVIASVLCGLAPNLQVLIAMRMVQGLVAGPMIVLTQPLLLQSYPREKMGAALSAYMLTTLVGPAIGPILGGYLTDSFSWPWIFYINLPVGILSLAGLWAIYRHRESPTVKAPIDYIGLMLLIVTIGSAQLMVEQGRELDWFSSREIVMLAIVAVIGLSFFLAWERDAPHPVVDFSHFRDRNFMIGSTLAALSYGMMLGSTVVMPIWLQQDLGYTPLLAGLATAPTAMMALLFTPLTGRLVQRVDLRIIVSVSFVMLIYAFHVRSGLESGTDMRSVARMQALMGIGLATFFVPMMTLTLQGVSPEKMASAAGVMSFMRYFAGSAGTSLMMTLWERRASVHAQHLNENIAVGNSWFSSWLARLTDLGLDPMAAIQFLERRIVVEAHTLAANDIYRLCMILFMIQGMTVWLCRSRKDRSPVIVHAE